MGNVAAEVRDAVLVLEDGTIVRGTGFGARGVAFGELVFTTGMTGYQESLTDPSYAGQILLFTYPLIGNYGVNGYDFESRQVWPRAVVVREHCLTPSHRDSEKTFDAFLQEHNIPGIAGVDTRALTVKTREKGCLRGFVCNTNPSDKEIANFVAEAKKRAYPSAQNLVGEVSTKKILFWPKGTMTGKLDESKAVVMAEEAAKRVAAAKKKGERTVVLYDFGLKWNILRSLARDFHVVEVPWDTPASTVRTINPDSLFLSNGPGDPAHPDIIKHPVTAIRDLVQSYPTWGICFGHQLLGHAFGGSTFKLPFGHRGANQPVRESHGHRFLITSQNHGYAVATKFTDPDIIVTEVNNNDGTVEALAHRRLPVRSCQYHPEANPGPRDAKPHFAEFIALVDGAKPRVVTKTAG